MINEELMGYKVFNRDSAKRVQEIEENGKATIFALIKDKDKFLLLHNCILDQEPYIVVVEKDVEVIDEKRFNELFFKKFD